MAAGRPSSRRHTLGEAQAPPRASRGGGVAEGSASAAARRFEALDVKSCLRPVLGEEPYEIMEAFEKVRKAVVDLDRLAERQLEVARRQATTLNTPTSTLSKLTDAA